jgi:hypothetical protein
MLPLRLFPVPVTLPVGKQIALQPRLSLAAKDHRHVPQLLPGIEGQRLAGI